MRKVKLTNWMGEDWFAEIGVNPQDPRLRARNAIGICDFESKTIVVGTSDESTMLTTLFHEVMHRAIDAGNGQDPELLAEYAGLMVLQFLRKFVDARVFIEE